MKTGADGGASVGAVGAKIGDGGGAAKEIDWAAAGGGSDLAAALSEGVSAGWDGPEPIMGIVAGSLCVPTSPEIVAGLGGTTEPVGESVNNPKSNRRRNPRKTVREARKETRATVMAHQARLTLIPSQKRHMVNSSFNKLC